MYSVDSDPKYHPPNITDFLTNSHKQTRPRDPSPAIEQLTGNAGYVDHTILLPYPTQADPKMQTLALPATSNLATFTTLQNTDNPPTSRPVSQSGK